MSAATPKPGLLVLTTTFPRWPDDHEPPFVFELARRLSDRFAVCVLAPHAPGAQRREQMAGIEVRRFRYAPARLERLAYDGGIPSNLRRRPWLIGLLPLFVLAQLWAAYRLAQRPGTAVVHAHWLIPGGLIGALLKRLQRRPLRLVVTAHGADVYGLRGRALLRLKRWLLREADLVTVVSDALARELRALDVPGDRLRIQGMGTDLSATFVPAARTDPGSTLMYAGRLVPKKGIDTLLEAAAAVYPRVPGLRVVIAGHGPERPALEDLGRRLGIADVLHFSGPYRLAELPALYAAASLAVFPFRATAEGDQDGLGLAIVEAMGCGVPVIGSDIAPLDELLIAGRTGWRAPADDSAAFAAAILAALSDPATAQRRAQAARRHVCERYDWSAVAARYADFLDPALSLTDARPPPAGS